MSTETRTTSSTGGEKGMKPERLDLLPREALEAISRVYAFGAEKYADHNWRKGYEWSKSYAALQRHLLAFWSGETFDNESGLPHLAHAGFHIFALLTWLEEDGEGGLFDDRYRPVDPGPLGPEWEDVGYVDETVPPDSVTFDLSSDVDQMREMVRESLQRAFGPTVGFEIHHSVVHHSSDIPTEDLRIR